MTNKIKELKRIKKLIITKTGATMKNYFIKIVNLETKTISKITRIFASEQDLHDFIEREIAARKALTYCNHAAIF